MWVGPGGALGAVAFFLVIRGGLAIIVGPVLGEVTPTFPLFVGEAICVELVALVISRDRPLAFGAAAGLAIGTVGFFTEYLWTDLHAPPVGRGTAARGAHHAAIAGVASGTLGALLASGLRGNLPRPALARPAFAAALLPSRRSWPMAS